MKRNNNRPESPRRRGKILLPAVILLAALGLLVAQQATYYFATTDENYGSFSNYDNVEQSAWDQEKAATEQRRQEKLARKNEDRERARAERAASDAAKQADLDSRKDELRAVPGSGTPMVFGYENATVDSLIDSHVYAREQARRSAEAGAGLPPGAAPAAGLTAVGVGAQTYYYGDGQFYILEGETRKPVPAPVTAMVFSIPDDSQSKTVDGTTFYECNGAWYQRSMFAGRVMYEVVEKPAGA